MGQHFTVPRVADLINAFCLRAGSDIVLDPACGSGAFLLRARARLRYLGGDGDTLRGVELDPRLARDARAALPGALIAQGDFLARPAERRCRLTPGAIDAVVGNPPYVRQELLGAARKRRLAAAGPAPLSRRSDLHIYFWHRAMDLLKEGGRLGFLTSGAWLDADYGQQVRRWLARSFRVVALIESETESWFDDARVRTVVTIVEKSAPGTSPARFARLDFRLEEAVPDGLAEPECLARFEQLACDLEQGARRARRIAAETLETGRWGTLLRQPDLWLEILSLARDRFVTLSEIATVSWGIKTGDDRFFFSGRDEPPPVEPRFLVPVVFNLMELDRVVVSIDQLRRRLLLVDTRDGPIAGLRVARHIRRAERQRGTHRRPTCAARRRGGVDRRGWFELRPGPPGEILWSIMHQYRHLAPFNPDGVPANDNMLSIRARPGIDPRLLACLLNTSLQALIKQAHGRWRNEGMLKMQASDVKGMLVPDPRRIEPAAARRIVRAFDALTRRPIGKLPEECLRPDRRRLDIELMHALGIDEARVVPLVECLHDTLGATCRSERRWELDAVRRRARSGRPTAAAPR